MTLIDKIRAIEQSLLSTKATTQNLQTSLKELQNMGQLDLTGEETLALQSAVETVKKLQKAYTDTGRTAKQNLEDMRKRMEGVVGQTTQLIDKLGESAGLTGSLARGLKQAGEAAGGLAKSGDVGRFIQQMTAGIPVVQSFGFVIGEVVSAQIKFQDQLRAINKTIIDSSAATGQFTRGMGLTKDQTEALRSSLADYEMDAGLTRDQTLGMISAFSKFGVTLEEMGIDEQTMEIQSFGDAIDGVSGKFGGLSTTIAMARSSGLDLQQTLEQIAFQTKYLGQEVSSTTTFFAELQISAQQSKLSTQILLPVIRSLQEQYKFLGIRSDKAARTIGLAAQAAEEAGLGPGVGAQIFGKAVGGFAGANFGIQAFVGQQLGMGGGLAAGFAARERPEEGAIGVAKIGRKLFGGREITREQAKGNEHLGAMRLGQEQLVSQMLGLNQLEASSFVDMTDELEELRKTGQEDSERAKELQRKIEEAARTEKDYAAKTLTAAQKIALLMEVLTATTSKILMAFIRGLTGGTLKGAEGAFADLFKGIQKGEGLDVLTRKAKKFADELGDSLTPAAEGFGRILGGVVGRFGGILGQLFSFGKELADLVHQLANSHKSIDRFAGNLLYGADAVREHALALQDTYLDMAKRQGTLQKITGKTGPQALTEVEKVAQGPKGAEGLFDLYRRDVAKALIEQATLEKQNKKTKLEDALKIEREKYGKELSRVSTRVNKSPTEWLHHTLTGEYKYRPATNTEAQEALKKARPIGEEVHRLSSEVNRLGSTINKWSAAVDKKDEFSRLTLKAQRALKSETKPSGDVWDIIQKGWLYASPGDVVIDAKSLGRYLGSGKQGSSLPKLNEKSAMSTTARMTTPMEQELVLKVSIVDDKLGKIFDDRIHLNIEKGVVQPGKEGISRLRRGSNANGYL